MSGRRAISKQRSIVLPSLPLGDEPWAALMRPLRLAPRQEKIVELIVRGLQDKEIAAHLGLKVPTVRTYLRRAFHRLDVENRMELVLKLFADSHREGHKTRCHHE